MVPAPGAQRLPGQDGPVRESGSVVFDRGVDRRLALLPLPRVADAAASVWCGREVEHWRAQHGSEEHVGAVDRRRDPLGRDQQRLRLGGHDRARCRRSPDAVHRKSPFHVDMRWARAEKQLDLTDGRFRDQVADLAAPVHGMAKDELASEDVRQHRRAIRQAIAAGVALVLLTIAAVVISVFAVNAAAAARRNAAHARRAAPRRHPSRARGEAQETLRSRPRSLQRRTRLVALARQARRTRSVPAWPARKPVSPRSGATELASLERQPRHREREPDEGRPRAAEVDAARRGAAGGAPRPAARELRRPDLSARHAHDRGGGAARVREQRDRSRPRSSPLRTIPNVGCSQPGTQIDGSVASSALVALSSAGGRFATARLAGSASPNLVVVVVRRESLRHVSRPHSRADPMSRRYGTSTARSRRARRAPPVSRPKARCPVTATCSR